MSIAERSEKTKRMVMMSLLIALVILQTWVPFLGNINIPPVSITFIHITVVIAALWMGPKVGAIVGLVWGINGMLRAYIAPVSPVSLLVFTSPLISVIPRGLLGLVLGYLGQKFKSRKTGSLVTFGVLGGLLNTLFVMSAIYFFKGNDYTSAMNVGSDTLLAVIGGVIMANGIPEAIFSGIMTPIIYRAIDRQSR